ncbi:MAG: hypothetical protein ACI4EA_08625 [Candidatus Ornithomonoglobus sp.]
MRSKPANRINNGLSIVIIDMTSNSGEINNAPIKTDIHAAVNFLFVCAVPLCLFLKNSIKRIIPINKKGIPAKVKAAQSSIVIVAPMRFLLIHKRVPLICNTL